MITSFLVKCILEVDHAKEVPVICCRKCVGIQHRYLCICAFKTLNSLYINQEDKLLTVPFCQLKCVFQIGISELCEAVWIYKGFLSRILCPFEVWFCIQPRHYFNAISLPSKAAEELPKRTVGCIPTSCLDAALFIS